MKNLLISAIAMTLLISTAEARRDQNREHIQQDQRNCGQKRIDHMQLKANADGIVTR